MPMPGNVKSLMGLVPSTITKQTQKTSKNNVRVVASSPIGSMYGIYANMWGILMVNVTIYGIHGSYGSWHRSFWIQTGHYHRGWEIQIAPTGSGWAQVSSGVPANLQLPQKVPKRNWHAKTPWNFGLMKGKPQKKTDGLTFMLNVLLTRVVYTNIPGQTQ